MNHSATDLLADFPVVIEQRVIWGDMDAYQHVNNVVYFRYFENVRIEYLTRIGWKDIEIQTGVGPIVSAIGARFRKPLHYPDTISIACRLGEMQVDRFILRHIIVSHKLQAVTTEGESTVVMYHYGNKQKAIIPDDMRHAIEQIEAKGKTRHA